MSLRIASPALAALFVASLALGSSTASADEGPVVKRPHRHHHHQHVRYVTRTVATPVYVDRPVYVERPVYANACGCGSYAAAAPVIGDGYFGYRGFYRAGYWGRGWRTWGYRRHVGIW
jgi:hypothetical protein